VVKDRLHFEENRGTGLNLRFLCKGGGEKSPGQGKKTQDRREKSGERNSKDLSGGGNGTSIEQQKGPKRVKPSDERKKSLWKPSRTSKHQKIYAHEEKGKRKRTLRLVEAGAGTPSNVRGKGEEEGTPAHSRLQGRELDC